MAENKKSDNNLKKLHEVQIEILDEIVRICNKHNLTYFLIYGTLIGAVRHKGFIPWDDDLDIGMPREDYEKFIKIAKKELDNKYYLQDISTDKEYWQNFIKIRKNNTLFDESTLENINTHKGIFVDIFPFDNINKDGIYRKVKWSILKNLYNFCLYYRGIYKKENVNHFVFCKILSKLKMKYILRFCDFYMRGKESSKYTIDYSTLYPHVMDKKWIYPTKEIMFENKLYSCPNDTDLFLKNIYGDYMKLPPKDKRVTHLPKKILFDIRDEENE